jgi:hypothetical protein
LSVGVPRERRRSWLVSAPKVFGFPVWVGLKKRIGKKLLRKDRDFRRRLLKEMAGLAVGDLVQDCSGLNRRIACVTPVYQSVGRGKVLIDLDFEMTDGSSCSFYHCGVGLPLSYEEAERYRAELVASEQTRGDPDGLARRYSMQVMLIHPDGTFTVDQRALAELERAASGDHSVN